MCKPQKKINLIVVLVMLLVVTLAVAEDYRFTLAQESTVNSVKLKPGKYRLSLDGHQEARIYHKGKMVVKSRVEVRPIEAGLQPESVVRGSDGILREIRLKRQRVVFTLETPVEDVGTALIDAAKKGDTALVRDLLSKGADLNAKDRLFGWTALMWAATKGHADTAESLLDAGADVSVKEKNGWTAAMMAGNEGYLNIEQMIKQVEDKKP